MIDLDELLYGEPRWADVVEFWQYEDFPDEHYLVAAIEKHLQTEDQRKQLFEARLSIGKLLNGRFPGDSTVAAEIFDAWNAKLGYKGFRR